MVSHRSITQAASPVLSLCLLVCHVGSVSAAEEPLERGLAWLAGEVRRWQPEHKCYSCHNNGDAVRALYAAGHRGLIRPAAVVPEASRWLSHPDGWANNGGDAEFSDKRLEAIQFGVAAATGARSGQISVKARAAALRRVVELRDDDGSWRVDTGGVVGSPITWGTTLATALVCRALSSQTEHKDALRAGRVWLSARRPGNVVEAASVIIGVEGVERAAAVAAREHCLGILRRGQRDDGGWGPYTYSSSTDFDSALALLAMAAVESSPDVRQRIAKGRKYLLAGQDADGSWLETVRGGDRESYAHRVSTTAWVVLALIRTSDPNGPDEGASSSIDVRSVSVRQSEDCPGASEHTYGPGAWSGAAGSTGRP